MPGSVSRRLSVLLRVARTPVAGAICLLLVPALAGAQSLGFAPPVALDPLLLLGPFDVSAPDQPAEPGDGLVGLPPIDVPLNDRVLRFVDLFQGRLRPFLTEGLTRGAVHLPRIQALLREEGVPADLAYVPLVESAFKTSALSRASARGIWQFMAGTASEFGLRTDFYVDERATVEKSTRAAARYFKLLHGMFGDWHLALASYNSGPGRVQRAMRQRKVTDYWRLASSRRGLPRETRDYVPMVLAAMVIARNPAQYGFEITPPEPEAPSDRVLLPVAVDLEQVADWISVSAADMQRLNPELRQWMTPPVGADTYELRVPSGTGARILEAFATADPATRPGLGRHTVRRGETLASIARARGVKRADLAQANYLRATARVRPGQQLLIPRAAPRPATAARRAPVSRTARASRSPDVPRRTTAVTDVRTYRVRSGDTLYGIARRHGVTVDELRAWNRLRSAALRVGAVLTIRVPRSDLAEQ